MRRALPSVLPWGLLLGGSTALFLVLRAQGGLDQRWSLNAPAGHFWIVSAASVICVWLGLSVVVAAARTLNARLLALGLSFLVMAGILTVHGLATPGFLIPAPSPPSPGIATPEAGEYAATVARTPFYNVTGFSSRLALTACAALLAFAAAPWPAGLDRWVVRHRLAILGAVILALLAYGVTALRAPWLVPTWLVSNEVFAWGVTSLVSTFGLFAAWRFTRSYLTSGQQMHGAVALGALLLVQAQFSLHFGAVWTGTFWLYHVQLLAGFAAMFWGIVIEFAHGRAVSSLETLIVDDVIEQLRSGYAEPVVALSAALEARDGYTLGHGERVAALAVMIASEMGISGRRLRGIAAGSLLHDVGKIGIPDAVLHKPAGLTTAEFDIIKEHPTRGAEMLRGQFDQKVEAEVIRHHHERWDGTGYPSGLTGEAIPLAARIAAVADVYDALRSNRAYRDAWSSGEALAMIESGAGAHFDPRCVHAFLAVVEQWERRYAADHQAYSERRAAA